MRNSELEKLDVLVGDWTLRLWNAWFLDSLDTEVHGSATIEWLGDAFVVMRSKFGGDPGWDFVFGRSDANDAYVALYHDERGVCRLFQMTFGDGHWILTREDPDFHQRLVTEVSGDRITGRAEASDDAGRTWRKDFDLAFERVGESAQVSER